MVESNTELGENLLWRTYIKEAADLIFTLDAAGKIASVNRAVCETTGYTAGELLGKNPLEFIPPESHPLVETRLRKLLSGESVDRLEVEVLSKDGRRITLEVRGRALYDKGRMVGALQIARDITERKRMEEEIKSLARFPSENPNPILRLDRQGTILSANRASNALLRDWSSGIGQLAPRFWRDLATDALSTGQSKNIDVELGGRSYTFLVKPVMEADYVNLYGRDITERKEAEQKLRLQSEIAENMFEGVVLTRASDGVIVYANPRFEEMLGYGSGELIGKNIATVNAPTNGKSPEEIAREIQTTLKETSVWTGEVLNVKKDGTPIWCRANVSTLESSQYGEIWVDTHEDITERKRAEEALRESVERERLLADLIRNASVAVGVGYPDGRIGSCNTAFCELTGYTEEELKTVDWKLNLTPPEWRELTSARIQEARRTKKAVRYEKEFARKDGSRVPIELVVHPWFDSEGNLQYVFSFITDITERKRMRDELRRYPTQLERLVLERTERLAESERRFRELSDLLPQIVFEIDENGGIQFMNRAAFAETGCTMEEFRKGVNAFQMLAPADHDRAKQGIQRIMTGETIGGREFSVLRRDGTTFPVIAYTAPIMRQGKSVGVRGIAIDIRERKRAEEELRAARERLEHMITSNPAVIFTARPRPDFSDFDATYMSRSVVSLLGFRPQDLIGRPEMWQARVHPDDLHRYYAELPLLWKEGEHTFEYRFQHKDGNYLWIREEAKVIRDAAGKPTEVMGYWTDITDEKQMDEMRDRFISAVTHELRTPLISVSGYLDLVLTGDSGPLSSEVKSNLEVVKRNTDRLTSLTDDLLDIQRLQSGKLQVNLQPIDFREIIEHATSEIKPFTKAKKQNFNVAVPRRPLLTLGDPTRLSEVLMNLLSNASKFTPEGGRIRLTVSDDKLIIVVKVADTGIGLCREDLTRVFEPFAAIKKPTHIKGTGLGLSVTKGLVEAHMGRIWAESPGEGKGATFTFALPKREVK
jgi:PAS domain S-box-containing protein